MRWTRESSFDNSMWHDWFAWHPVGCEGMGVWLEVIERRFIRDTVDWELSHWEYRFKTPQHPCWSGEFQ